MQRFTRRNMSVRGREERPGPRERCHQTAAGVILCVMREQTPYVVLLTQSKEHYQRRPDSRDMVDIGPKGKIADEHEKLRDCARREAKEEVGLDVDLDAGFICAQRYWFKTLSNITDLPTRIEKTVTYFLALIAEEDAARIRLSDEHSGFEIVPIDEAVMKLTRLSQAEVLMQLKVYLNGARSSRALARN